MSPAIEILYITGDSGLFEQRDVLNSTTRALDTTTDAWFDENLWLAYDRARG